MRACSRIFSGQQLRQLSEAGDNSTRFVCCKSRRNCHPRHGRDESEVGILGSLSVNLAIAHVDCL